jgi:hypothetical protein
MVGKIAWLNNFTVAGSGSRIRAAAMLTSDFSSSPKGFNEGIGFLRWWWVYFMMNERFSIVRMLGI